MRFFKISLTLQNWSPINYLESSYRSDRLSVALCIKRNKFLKGKGIRKSNNSPLNDKEYIEIVKQIVLEVDTQDFCVVYNRGTISCVPVNNVQFIICDQLL